MTLKLQAKLDLRDVRASSSDPRKHSSAQPTTANILLLEKHPNLVGNVLSEDR